MVVWYPLLWCMWTVACSIDPLLWCHPFGACGSVVSPSLVHVWCAVYRPPLLICMVCRPGTCCGGQYVDHSFSVYGTVACVCNMALQYYRLLLWCVHVAYIALWRTLYCGVQQTPFAWCVWHCTMWCAVYRPMHL